MYIIKIGKNFLYYIGVVTTNAGPEYPDALKLDREDAFKCVSELIERGFNAEVYKDYGLATQKKIELP